jgi:hypothetical protein
MSSFGFRTKFRLSAALFYPPGQKSKRLVCVPKIAQKLLVRVFPLAETENRDNLAEIVTILLALYPGYSNLAPSKGHSRAFLSLIFGAIQGFRVLPFQRNPPVVSC